MIFLLSRVECCLSLFLHLIEILVKMTNAKISLVRDTYVIEFINMSLCKYFYFEFEFTILVCAHVCRSSLMLIHGMYENRMSFLQKLKIPDFVGSNGRAKRNSIAQQRTP